MTKEEKYFIISTILMFTVVILTAGEHLKININYIVGINIIVVINWYASYLCFAEPTLYNIKITSIGDNEKTKKLLEYMLYGRRGVFMNIRTEYEIDYALKNLPMILYLEKEERLIKQDKKEIESIQGNKCEIIISK